MDRSANPGMEGGETMPLLLGQFEFPNTEAGFGAFWRLLSGSLDDSLSTSKRCGTLGDGGNAPYGSEFCDHRFSWWW
ncbi:MAG: hypothetical protein V3V21_09510 [Thermoplasmata archaeon]